MKKFILLLLLLSLLMLLSSCKLGESRYDDQETIDEILLENGITDVVFIEGWGSNDTFSIQEYDLLDIPELLGSEKATIAVGYDVDSNLKFLFIPQMIDRDILVYDFPFPDFDIIEDKVTEYNDSLPIQGTCSNEINLEMSSDYTMHTSDNFGLTYFDTHNITEYNLMLFIGTSCIDQNELSVLIIQFSQSEFGIIATKYQQDIYHELSRFSLE